MNTDQDLNSSVELIFKTDYLPLDRMAGKGQVDRIKVNTINPEVEEKLASQERQTRLQGARAADAARDKSIDESLKSPAPPPPSNSSPVDTVAKSATSAVKSAGSAVKSTGSAGKSTGKK